MKTTITGISGIALNTAITLHEHGFDTVPAIAGATIGQLSSVPGFGTTRASRVIRAANELLATTKSSKAMKAHSATRQKSTALKSAAKTTGTGRLADVSEKELTKKERKKAAKLEKEKARKEKEKKARLKKEKKKAAKLKKKLKQKKHKK